MKFSGLNFYNLDDVESLIETSATPQRIEGFEDFKIVALTAGTNFVSVFTGISRPFLL